MNPILNTIKYNAVIITTVLFLLSSGVYSQIDYEKMKAAELATHWLNKDCDVGENGTIFQHLKRLAVEIEPLFIKAYQSGPDGQEISGAEKDAAARFQLIQNALKSGQTFGLTKEELEIARKQTATEFVANEKKNFILGYKSQALTGLAYTAGPDAKKILETESKNEKSELNLTARYALKKLQGNKE